MIAVELIAVRIYGNIFLGHFAGTGFIMPADLRCFWANGALVGNHAAIAATDVKKICAFMYPPPFLLLTAPLSFLSPLTAYIVWIVAANVSLVLAARRVRFSWGVIFGGIVSPPNLYCIATGQTGEFISALLLLSFGLATTSPVIAGIMAGCLAIKPQFGILLPICFLASRNWQALGAAIITAVALCLLTTLFFGGAVWGHFFYVETVTTKKILDAAWPQPFQGIMVTVFMLLRSLGASLSSAYSGQAAMTLAAAGGAWYIWSVRQNIEGAARLVAMFCLVVLATPYAYLYDLPGLAMVLLAYTARMNWPFSIPLILFWIVTSSYILISMVGFVAGGFFVSLLLIYIWQKIFIDNDLNSQVFVDRI